MRTSRSALSRALAVLAAVLLMALSLGVAGFAAADPGNEKGGGGQAASAPGAAAPATGSADQASGSNGNGGSKSNGSPKKDAGPAPAADQGPAGGQQADPAKASGPAKPDKPAKSGASTAKTNNGNGGSNNKGGKSGSGSLDQPQPLSGADQNSGGANGQCPGGAYCSTRDGSPSGNGNGNGKATGKPCAGCVGKADNKNPKGQKPNGSDKNKGYECDGNNGIGKSNPAHTGCTNTPPTCEQSGDCPPPTCEQSGDCPPPTCEQSGDCPPPTCEQSGDCPPPTCEDSGDCPPPGCEHGSECSPPPGCEDESGCRPSHHDPKRPPVVLGTQATRPPGGGVLPSTGLAADALPLLAAGAALAVLGSLLMARRRRSPGS